MPGNRFPGVPFILAEEHAALEAGNGDLGGPCGSLGDVDQRVFTHCGNGTLVSAMHRQALDLAGQAIGGSADPFQPIFFGVMPPMQ